MNGATLSSGKPAARGTIAPAAGAVAILALCWTAPGCGDSSPPPVSPVVSVDSEEGRKALAEDQVEREIRKQKEAKFAARKKKLVLPVEPE